MEKIIDKIGAFDFLSVFFVGILSNSIISISINANIFCYGETDFIKGMSFVALFWHGIVIQQIALLIDQITFNIRDKYKHNYLDRKNGVFKIETDYNNCVNIILKIIGTSDITQITHKDCKYIYNYCKSYLEKSNYIHLINNTTTLLASYRNLSVLLCFFIVFFTVLSFINTPIFVIGVLTSSILLPLFLWRSHNLAKYRVRQVFLYYKLMNDENH